MYWISYCLAVNKIYPQADIYSIVACQDFDLFTVLFLQQILFPNILAGLEPGRTSQVSFRFVHVHLLLQASPDLTIYFKIFLLNEHYTQITTTSGEEKHLIVSFHI